MSQKKKQAYTEDKIKTLSSLEHIRLRTGMYIGRTGSGAHYDDGIYILVKEVIDNGILVRQIADEETFNISICSTLGRRLEVLTGGCCVRGSAFTAR